MCGTNRVHMCGLLPRGSASVGVSTRSIKMAILHYVSVLGFRSGTSGSPSLPDTKCFGIVSQSLFNVTNFFELYP